jgi:hypothetical protein
MSSRKRARDEDEPPSRYDKPTNDWFLRAIEEWVKKERRSKYETLILDVSKLSQSACVQLFACRGIRSYDHNVMRLTGFLTQGETEVVDSILREHVCHFAPAGLPLSALCMIDMIRNVAESVPCGTSVLQLRDAVQMAVGLSVPANEFDILMMAYNTRSIEQFGAMLNVLATVVV